jgi:hypothetical protein
MTDTKLVDHSEHWTDYWYICSLQKYTIVNTQKYTIVNIQKYTIVNPQKYT